MAREVDEIECNKELLRSKESLREILKVAILFERTAYSFYSELAPKVSKKMRHLMNFLIKEEEQHVKIFSDLLQHPNIEQQLSQMVTTPSSNPRFSEAFQIQDLGENPDEQTVLRYAMFREQAAMEQYTFLAKEVPPGAIRDLFFYLSQQENEHKDELEKLYKEAVLSGDNFMLSINQIEPVQVS